MPITTFNKESVNQLAKEVHEALAAIAARHGLTYAGRGGSYTKTEFTPRGGFALQVVDGVPLEQMQFNDLCSLFRLKPEHYLRVFDFKGEAFKLVGFAPKRSRFPIRGMRVSDGKVLLFTEEVLPKIIAAPSVHS